VREWRSGATRARQFGGSVPQAAICGTGYPRGITGLDRVGCCDSNRTIGDSVEQGASCSHLNHDAIDAFIDRWRDTGGKEPENYQLFLIDQALHVLASVLIAWYFRDAWNQGWWAAFPGTWQTGFLTVLSLVAGFVLATGAGGFVIGMFMAGFETSQPSDDKSDQGVIHGGKWIGLLERALIFVLVLAQQFQAIGFLIAAKSILRFHYAKERSHSETVIIGTLASFGWAIAVSWGTLELIELLNAATSPE